MVNEKNASDFVEISEMEMGRKTLFGRQLVKKQPRSYENTGMVPNLSRKSLN